MSIQDYKAELQSYLPTNCPPMKFLVVPPLALAPCQLVVIASAAVRAFPDSPTSGGLALATAVASPLFKIIAATLTGTNARNGWQRRGPNAIAERRGRC